MLQNHKKVKKEEIDDNLCGYEHKTEAYWGRSTADPRISHVTEKNLKSGSNLKIYSKRVGFGNRNISWKDMLFMGHIRMLLRVGVLLASKVSRGVNQTARALCITSVLKYLLRYTFCFLWDWLFSNWFSCIFISNFTLLQNILCVAYLLLYYFAFTS